jgi:cyclopropane-fatty-acyl-phospholipid synthase
MNGIELAERGWLPDVAVRLGIRRLLAERLTELRRPAEASFLASLHEGPVALVPERANDQHYEVDPAFFAAVLGPRRKYSCALFPSRAVSLAEAEEHMLRLGSERARLADGQRILELGCGWGSLTLWMAERYPRARITAVSNSKAQAEVIRGHCERAGHGNVEVVTAEVGSLDLRSLGRFDRVVSVEMFEHMRNWSELLRRVERVLVPGGVLFLHFFCHRGRSYPYEARGPGDWMARTFFSGGLMPGAGLLEEVRGELRIARRWHVGGLHYQRTCEAWLANLDRRRSEVEPALARSYGPAGAPLWRRRWRLFLLACSELFGFRGGSEWFVQHARLETPR